MYYYEELTAGERSGLDQEMSFEGLDSMSIDIGECHLIELRENMSALTAQNNPEKVTIRRDLFRHLSDGAVEVFDEFSRAESISIPRTHTTFVKERGWSKGHFLRAMRELKVLASNFFPVPG